MAWMPKVATARERRLHYRENLPAGFDALAELYYAYWGEYFHLAVFEPGDDLADLAAAYQRTHERYLAAIGASGARRILDVACGGGAVGVAGRSHHRGGGRRRPVGRPARPRPPLARGQAPAHPAVRPARRHAPRRPPGPPVQAPFDAAVCLDTACYLPDRRAARRQIAARLRPGGRLLLVDWCQAERPTALQRELLLEPLCRYWAIGELETAAGYRCLCAAAGLRIRRLDDLSERVGPNWERGYQAALRALAEPVRLGRLLRLAAATAAHGSVVVQAAKDQFQVALLAKAAAESGLLRYVSVLAERPEDPATGRHPAAG